MKNRILLNIFLCTLLPVFIVAQIPPDSLPGYYIGEYWFRVEDDPWDIRIDTIYVVNANPNGCWLEFYDWNDNFNTTGFASYYGYCTPTNPPENWYTLFHSLDSITEVYDNYSTPPPNPELRSHRFYGKKAWITTVVEQKLVGNKLIVYPNPADDWILLNGMAVGRYNPKVSFRILSLTGNKVLEGVYYYNDRINVADLRGGIYMVVIESGESLFMGKLVKL